MSEKRNGCWHDTEFVVECTFPVCGYHRVIGREDLAEDMAEDHAKEHRKHMLTIVRRDTVEYSGE